MPRSHSRDVVAGRLGEDHADGEGLVGVGNAAECEQAIDEVAGRGRVGYLPVADSPASSCNDRPDLGDALIDMFARDSESLHDGRLRPAARAESDDEARIDNALVSRPELRVRVGVLGELTDHDQAARSRLRVSRRCSGITLMSASTGMKLVSPPQRGTMCSCRCAAMLPPATSPRFQPTLNASGL